MAKSTIGGKTVEEIYASGMTPAEFMAEALEASGGRMTLVQHDKDGGKKVYTFTGCSISAVSSELIEEDPSIEYVKIERL